MKVLRRQHRTRYGEIDLIGRAAEGAARSVVSYTPRYSLPEDLPMDATLFSETVARLSSRRPFSPFTIRLNDGSYFEVDSPNMLATREGVAVGIAPGKIPVWFDHQSVTRVDEDIAGGSPEAPASSVKA